MGRENMRPHLATGWADMAIRAWTEALENFPHESACGGGMSGGQYRHPTVHLQSSPA